MNNPVIRTRIPQKQLDELKSEAGKMGLNVSEYLRMLLNLRRLSLKAPPSPSKEVDGTTGRT